MTWYQRFLSFLVAAAAGLSGLFGITWTDAYEPDTFPLIAVCEQAADTVRVCSFNIRNTDVNGTGMEHRILNALQQISEIAPDSMGVQEATTLWMPALRSLAGYGVVGKCRDPLSIGEFNPIVYNKQKYRLLDAGTFWLSETPQEPSVGWDAAYRRICTWAVLKNRKTGEAYAHINSHFDNQGKTAQLREAEMIVAFATELFPGLPVVFTADLNSRPGSQTYQILTAALTDTRTASPDSVGFGTFHNTQPQTHRDDIIDYIMVNEAVQPLAYRTVTTGVSGRFVSDHFPIYADIRLQDSLKVEPAPNE